jgi:glycosyltransferase involved in cell wall biosynthesis
MMNRKCFVYLGCPGFPQGFAEVKKMTLIAKSLVMKGNPVTIVANRGIYSDKESFPFGAEGNYEGIDFIYTSGSPFRPGSFIKRNLLKIRGILKECLFVRNLKRSKKLDYAILSTNSFFSVFYYCVLSKIFRFKTILNYVEYYSAINKEGDKLGLRINNKLFDRYAPRMADFVFPISEFLIYHLKDIAPEKKYLKVPILSEFSDNNTKHNVENQKYFLFCGALSYIEVVKFIIDSFCLLNNNSVFLYLVVNGSKEQKDKLDDYLRLNSQKSKIKIFSNLEQDKLEAYYNNATGLLIPLRPTIQDEARFPHKIGEYLASGNPVISTNFGEVKHYFTDGENMLIAEGYDPKSFAGKMQFVLDNMAAARKIGENGREMSLKNFDYKLYGERIVNFLAEGNLSYNHKRDVFGKTA